MNADFVKKDGAGGTIAKRQKKATRKKAAKHTTLWMEMAESKDAEYVGECVEVVEAAEVKGVTAGEETVEAKETTTQEMEVSIAAAVVDTVTDIIVSVETTGEVAPTRVSSSSAVASRTSPGKGKHVPSALTTKRRRGARPSDESGNDAYEPNTPFSIRSCMVDNDHNLMETGANQCTHLNSDDDPDVSEELEDEEDADDDNWDGDWEIGALSDGDSEVEQDEIEDSIWSSAAKDARMISSMRHDGWEDGAYVAYV
ncbi:Pleiotropic drug resistance protein [Phytophthora palmivora]|uniref:Pleiotropic drug resistance protein n=1 Tax=Phytophthora palmivora TaxID=4796 RepID=A0A2P4XJ56_9STRA|nr:Pleiotropic drug resistance protein [Phytophthora palmivora]